MNRFRCKLAQTVYGARRWNGQLWGSKGQKSRSHEAEVRVGGLAEASFSSLHHFGLVWLRISCCID